VSREGTEGNPPVVTILLLAIWPLGALALLARLLVGRTRLRAIAARAWAPDDAAWTRLVEEEKRLAGVSGPVRLLVSPAASTPMTWGTRVPIVLLPEDALEWAGDHRRIVLRHELAHVARGDALAHSVATVACAVYWFHPLALLAARRMRTERERACDDRVLALGTGPGEYASLLLDVARAAREIGSPGLLSLAMARPSQFKGRVLAVLDGSRPRTPPTRRARIGAVSLPLALAVVGAAFHPVSRVATQSGDVAARERVPVQMAANPAPTAGSGTVPTMPARMEALPATAGAGVLASAMDAPVDTPAVERVAAPVASLQDGFHESLPETLADTRSDHGRTTQANHPPYVDVVLRADPTLPRSAPVQIRMTRDENLVLVNDDVARPLDLRVAIELLKQVRATYGRDVPGGAVQMSVPPRRVPGFGPRDAEPYSHLLAGLRDAPSEVINGRPAARQFTFGESPAVEMAVSDSTLARLMTKPS
jgi:beta-lactamase regulating signal transducer with metallopeptidase domain